jgi:arabinofuranosyltransferase
MAAAVLLAWAVVPAASGGPPYTGGGPHGVDDERAVWIARSDLHPVSVDDYARDGTWFSKLLISRGRDGAQRLAAHDRALLGFPYRVAPTKESSNASVVLAYGAIGMMSVAGGPELYIADIRDLADPIGARFQLHGRGKPGHEKLTPTSWLVARYTVRGAVPPQNVDAAEVAAARDALRCPVVRRLLARAVAPLTPARALSNFLDAFRLHSVRISSDPEVVARRCAHDR